VLDPRHFATLRGDEEGEASELAVPEVARHSGVSLRTVYRYFPTREELLAATGDWIAGQFLESHLPERLDLNNMLAWVTMRDEAGLDGSEVGAAVGWAMSVLIDDLRRRQRAAGGTKRRRNG